MNSTYPHLYTLLEATKHKGAPSSHRTIGNASPAQLMMTQAEAVVAHIKTHCKSWISESGLRLVWRGDQSFPPDHHATIKTLRNDRIPRDSSIDHHNAINASIANQGKVANRTNGMFVSGNIEVARYYDGTLVAVFPMGEFNYTWSPVIADATDDFSYDYHRVTHVTDSSYLWMAHVLRQVWTSWCNDWKVKNKNKPLKYQFHPLLAVEEIATFDRVLRTIDSHKLNLIVTLGLQDVDARTTIQRFLMSPDGVKLLSNHMRVIQSILVKRKISLTAREMTILAMMREIILADVQDGIEWSKSPQRNTLETRWAAISQVMVKNGAPETVSGPQADKLWQGDDGTLQRAIMSRNEIIIKANEVVLCTEAFTLLYILPLLKGKKLDVNATYKQYISNYLDI